MSWTEELFKIYEYNSTREFGENEPIMLPVSHSTANAQIELIINENGEFRGARTVEKSEAVTIIPATEDSAARSSGICPMPYADKLLYIAGDYSEFASGKRADNTDYYNAYMAQLKLWCDSEYSYYAVEALFKYLEKKCLMHDLIAAGVLHLDEVSGKLKEKIKIAGISQEDSFVRVIVISHEGINHTWLDKKLYESFILFNGTLMGEEQLCYGSGEIVPATYKHPSKIRNSGDKAKLISANDESGFTYRGRFAGKEEAVSVGYVYSQKVHNALRWLISKQGATIGSLTIIVWASQLQKVQDFQKKFIEDDDIIFEDEKEEFIPVDISKYRDLLKKRIFGYKADITPNTKVMLMGLDAATTGRINISLYSEIEASDYYNNIEKWHSQTAWNRFNGKKKKKYINSFSLTEIVNCAFGTEHGAFIECDSKFLKDNILRLVPCVTNGKPVPEDVVRGLYYKASNPLSYDNNYNHRVVLETSCAMIRKNMIDKQKGDISMSYDPEIKDKSYLYGCLLAIADKAESESYDESERNSRITNARRYWNAFSQRPYQTWGIIEGKLRPYLDKLKKSQVKYNKWINEITEKMSPQEFADNSRLEPMYLLGYHHFTDYMYNALKNKEEK